jgi:hypothetical protein
MNPYDGQKPENVLDVDQTQRTRMKCIGYGLEEYSPAGSAVKDAQPRATNVF